MHQNKDIWDFKSGKVILQNDVHYEIIKKLFQYLDFKTTPFGDAKFYLVENKEWRAYEYYEDISQLDLPIVYASQLIRNYKLKKSGLME